MSDHRLSSVCLVGDRFAAFASHDNVRTVSQLVAEVGAGAYDTLSGPLLVWEGQGVTDYEREYVRGALDARGLGDKLLMQPNDPDPVPRAQVHKHREVNVLLSGLCELSPGRYHAALRLHSDNELLLDHQSGEHVQGMVVVEAFRQMFIACCERFTASRQPSRRYYYIWHGMDIRFERFVFPLDADIDCTVTDSRTDDPSRLAMTVDLELRQTGHRCAVARIDFTAHDAERISAKEHVIAARAVTTVLGGAGHEPLASVVSAG
ncbi:AfsA-related hotdog domain-containing protein [Streptomyces calidiresistens]|nr:AfsA-related hotdog domain-containing protein [Streptomyces calidiresistens]